MRHRWYFWLGYPWAIPGTILGLLLAIVYRPTSWRWSDGCIEALGGDRIWGKPGAQTLGFVIYYRDEVERQNDGLRVHERVHVVQGLAGGVFFLLGYAAHFCWLYARNGFHDWMTAYRHVWAERQAYRIQHEYEAGMRPRAWGANVN